MGNKLKSLLKQAELLQGQGLFKEAKETYERVEEIIKKNIQIQNREKLLKGIAKRIDRLNKDSETLESAAPTPQVSPHVKELIKKLFSFSKDENDKNGTALEEAIALAKFGQFEDALAEFYQLIKIDSLRVAAAKNIVRCHLTLNDLEAIESQIEEWHSDELFTEGQLDKVRMFFDNLLDQKGVKRNLEESGTTKAGAGREAAEPDEDDDEEFLDISAVAISFNNGPQKGEQVELDISFQTGNIISLIIPSKDQELLEKLDVGTKLDDVHFYSPIAIFRGSGIVKAKTQISSGPKKGDYSMDIKIESI